MNSSNTLLLLIVLAVVGTTLATSLVAQDERRMPLDLPSGGDGANDDEEDVPEIISFYGGEYEGDVFVWCFDRSGSMGWGGAMNDLKVEMSAAISQLSGNAQFSMVRFNTSVESWSQTVQRATTSKKLEATTWVQNTSAVSGTCLGEGAVQAINIANGANRPHVRVILVGDGVPECGGGPSPAQNQAVVNNISSANFKGLPIDTIFISASQTGIALFQQIASQNGGTFSNPQ